MPSTVPLRELPLLRKTYARKRIVLVGGAFDLLHPGHIHQLLWARSKGDILVVHITGDRRYKEKRKRPPVFPARERAMVISALRPVEHVFIYDGKHYDQKIISLIQPDILIFNKEAFTPEVKRAVASLVFKGKILVSSLKKEYSSSELRKKLSRSK